MGLLNKEHFFISLITIKDIINLLKRNQRILLRSNEYSRRSNELHHMLQIHIVYIKISFLKDDRLYILISDIQ